MLDTFEVSTTGSAAAKLAWRLPIGDFEDALQVTAAIEAGVDYIITRDLDDYQNSPIPARTPDAFLVSQP